MCMRAAVTLLLLGLPAFACAGEYACLRKGISWLNNATGARDPLAAAVSGAPAGAVNYFCPRAAVSLTGDLPASDKAEAMLAIRGGKPLHFPASADDVAQRGGQKARRDCSPV